MAVYSTGPEDSKDTMRIHVLSLETGDELWDAPASPGGAWASPLFDETNSVGRTYPVPTIQPLLATRGTGDDATPVIVYFNRKFDDSPADIIGGDDFLRVADLATGDILHVTIPGYDPADDYFDSVHEEYDDPSTLIARALSPGRQCGDGPTFCFDESEGGYISLDVGALEVQVTDPVVPDDGVTYSPEWGDGWAHVVSDDATEASIARIEDASLLWQRENRDIFEDDRTSPPNYTEFTVAGELVLMQGYQPISTTPELGNQLDLDYADSRTVAALDPATGETSWILPGGDQLCYLLANAPRDPDAEVLPMCLATGGFFSYTYETDEMVDSEDPVVSVVGVNVADGSIEWELELAGIQSVLMQARQVDAVFDSRATFAATVVDDEAGLVDLSDGTWAPAPEKDAGFVCKSERPGVLPQFEGSVFAAGTNPITLEYPAGWFSFACDGDTEAASTWTKGAVRVAGYDVGDNRRLLVTEDGLAAFEL